MRGRGQFEVLHKEAVQDNMSERVDRKQAGGPPRTLALAVAPWPEALAIALAMAVASACRSLRLVGTAAKEGGG